eukprot:gene3182-1497_t
MSLVSTLSLVIEDTPEFLQISKDVLPILKTQAWVNQAKETIAKHPHKSQLVTKRLGTTDFSIAYVVYDSANRTCRYINQNNMKTWKLKETELRSLALRNIVRLCEGLSLKPNEIFRESQTGVYSFDKLGNFSASLLLLQHTNPKENSGEKSRVYQIPSSNLLLAASSTDAMATCVMGDLSLRFARSKPLTGLQPIAYRNGWIPYEHNKVDHQFPVPLNKDEINTVGSVQRGRRERSAARSFAFSLNYRI